MNNNWLISFLATPILIALFINSSYITTYASDGRQYEPIDALPQSQNNNNNKNSISYVPKISSSAFADVELAYTKPLYTPGQIFNIPAGKEVEFVISFVNKGQQNFTVKTVEALFHNPEDLNQQLQHFPTMIYNRTIRPSTDATISYTIVPLPITPEIGRPFMLKVVLNYRDANGLEYSKVVFQETVLIGTEDEGWGSETFLYIFLAIGLIVVLWVINHEVLGSRKSEVVADLEGNSNSTKAAYSEQS